MQKHPITAANKSLAIGSNAMSKEKFNAQLKILQKQLGLNMKEDIKLPSLHKTITARSKHPKIGFPQIAN